MNHESKVVYLPDVILDCSEECDGERYSYQSLSLSILLTYEITLILLIYIA